MSRHLLLLACWLTVGTSPAQGLTFAEGSDLAHLSIAVRDELQPTLPGTVLLQQVEPLPVELTQRTADNPLRFDRPRRIERNGLWRIELPDGGRLFRYRRSGGLLHGVLWVPADGRAVVPLELPGGGANGLGDPFADRIGVAPDGRHAVLPALAGGFHILRLDGAAFPSTGAAVRFVASAPVVPESTAVGSTHAFVVTTNGRLLRCPLADGGVPIDCTPPLGANDRLKTELALSGDGSTVAFVAGPQDRYSLYLLRSAGAASMLPPPPAKYEEPDYLPLGSGHPHLLLNHDATRLLYVDGTVRDELHLLDVSGALPGLQITADPIFQPYIGIHILPSFRGNVLLLAIGDAQRMDWYRTELTAAGGSVVNLTGTGSMQQPYPSGTIDPVLATTSRAGAVLTTEQGPAGTVQLRAVDPTSATSALLQTGLLGQPVAGASFGTAPDLLVPGAGDRLYRGTTLVAATPPGVLLTAPNHGPHFAATFVHLAGGFGIPSFYLPDGTILGANIEVGVRQLCMTRLGGCVVVGNPVRYLAPGAFAVLPLPNANVRLCLSGAGS